MHLVFCFVFLLTFAGAVIAEEPAGKTSVLQRLKGSRWESYSQTENKKDDSFELRSFDPTRVELLPKRHYRVWLRADFSEPQTVIYGNSQYLYTELIEQKEVDCRALSMKPIRQVYYGDLAGEPVFDWKAPFAEWETTVPGTNGEQNLRWLCERLKRFR